MTALPIRDDTKPLQKTTPSIELAKPESSAAATKKRVLIIDDHPIFRHGITTMINREDDLEVCGEASTAPMGLERMRRLNPDIIVLDISIPGSNGIELLKSIRAEAPHIPMLVLSMHDESLYAARAIRAGALGYVMKLEAVDSILSAIRKVVEKEPYISPKYRDRLILDAVGGHEPKGDTSVDVLSDRELEVLTLMGRGRSAQETADELHLSIKTIETHRAHIKEKLQFSDAKQLQRFAIMWNSRQAG
ncbi:MAG: response regulator transcription factor [Thermomicrobiales bacterium]